MRTIFVLLLTGGLAAACSSSEQDSGAKPDAGADSSLPTTFGDCASPPCQVALEAFTKNPSTLPYCESTKPAVDCSSGSEMFAGTCGDLYAIRSVYGFPGDFYECIYRVSSDALVGAKWSPDSHPVQIAGEQLPTGCQLDAACPDGGASDAATD